MEIKQKRKYNAQTQNQHWNADDWEENGRLGKEKKSFWSGSMAAQQQENEKI